MKIKKYLPLQKDLNIERFPYCSLNGFFDFFFVDFELVPLKRIYIEAMKVRSHNFSLCSLFKSRQFNSLVIELEHDKNPSCNTQIASRAESTECSACRSIDQFACDDEKPMIIYSELGYPVFGKHFRKKNSIQTLTMCKQCEIRLQQ